MYRPEGLEVPEKYKAALALSPDKQTQYLLDNIWLAGADAMLEGLRAQDSYMEFTGTMLVPSDCLEKKGYLVFIPEEKDA